ncbi:MAG TPA: response regulator [Bacteroidales bacterium]|nr:response regulator [Bacteroidales bacterium]HPB24653.1 response regulator [Bacteroidales bacterium]HPI30965.1 response regulator [Bacteroidales bacterium]HQN15093.1 response regulator [Bacteroidales bacterium]
MNKYSIDILLVEDNPLDAELTIRTLKKHHIANNVFTVTDGVQALDYLFHRGSYSARENGDPRVIFLDIKLPKVNGLEILKQIKADNNLNHIPVVMLTSSAEDPDIKTAYNLGANSYVVKPVDINSFTETINNLGMYWLVINQPPK